VTQQALEGAWREAGTITAPGEGLLLQTPRTGSPLDLAGMLRGDRLLAIDDQEIRSISDIQAAIRKHPIGDDVLLRLRRGTEPPRNVSVKHVSDYPKR